MHLKNNAARLITINMPNGDSFDIIPGVNQTTEVPNEARKLAFVKRLLASGDLVEAAGEQAEDEPDERAELVADLEALGVKADGRWSIDRLKAELEKAQEG